MLAVSVFEVFTHPVAVDNWWQAISTSHGNPLLAVGFALLVFPKLALGLSGFETGVAVMPQIRGHARAIPRTTRPAASQAPASC